MAYPRNPLFNDNAATMDGGDTMGRLLHIATRKNGFSDNKSSMNLHGDDLNGLNKVLANSYEYKPPV